MIIVKHNITLLRDILLLGKISDFFIRTLIMDRRQNKEFKLYNYNGVDVTCCSVVSNQFGGDEYICFDMRNYNVKIALKKCQIAIVGDYEKVFNKDIVANIKKIDKTTTKDEKISILNELKSQIKDISK